MFCFDSKIVEVLKNCKKLLDDFDFDNFSKLYIAQDSVLLDLLNVSNEIYKL